MPSFEQTVAIEIKKLAAVKTLRAESTRLGLKLFPVENRNTEMVVYERQGIIRGVQANRGLNGPTQPVRLPGFQKFQVSPGYYGEHINFFEGDILQRRPVGDWFKQEPVRDKISEATTYLNERYLNARELNNFAVLLNGGYQAKDRLGNVRYQVMYNVPRLAPGTVWSNLSGSTPLADLRGWMMSLRLGASVDFRMGEMWMNTNTLNTILSNTNPADLGGKRLEYGQTINNQRDQETLFLGNGLPKIRLYDEDYFPDTGGAVRFIPDGRVIFVGKRDDGQPLGSYVMTPAAQNDNKPGEWVVVEDGRQKDTPYLKVSQGHNGVTVLEYPEAVASATVY